MPAVNDLERCFRANTGRQIHKWHHYFEIYDRHLARFRGSDVHVLEFGVAQGGSMQMWKEYFGLAFAQQGAASERFHALGARPALL